MTFGEKLQKCRKEAGLSQEELAEQLDVSRQAVSKWERDSGYPETEKLIRMSRLFHVTLDYLLLEEAREETAAETAQAVPDQGLYVSRELAEGYLSHRRRRLMKLGVGWGLLVGSLSLSFWSTHLGSVLDTVLMIAAVLLLVSAKLSGDPYRNLRQQPLVFDETVRQEFTAAWDRAKGRTHGLALLGLALMAAGILVFPLLDLHPQGRGDILLAAGFVLAGIGTFLCVYMIGLFRAFRVLCES